MVDDARLRRPVADDDRLCLRPRLERRDPERFLFRRRSEDVAVGQHLGAFCSRDVVQQQDARSGLLGQRTDDPPQLPRVRGARSGDDEPCVRPSFEQAWQDAKQRVYPLWPPCWPT